VTEEAEAIRIPVEGAELSGDLSLPEHSRGTVLFAHGSGSSRLSPRNRSVARQLREHGLATLLFDLLTDAEERVDSLTREYRFDIPLLAGRLVTATTWLGANRPGLGPFGYFGASTGAAAALIAAAALPDEIKAVVSRGGRPDLAGDALGHVRAPVQLIVGGNDRDVLQLNRTAMRQLHCEADLVVIPGATHLFEETGALEAVALSAAAWFVARLTSATPREP
jgi:dienelactone hydrolase